MKVSFDLHLHSCLSPCGDDDMTPHNIAGMCALAGIQIAALTDHNTCGNCAAFSKAADGYGILALPGMELCTLEEVHVVCLLPNLALAAAFQEEVYINLPIQPNDEAIFGRQIYRNEEDKPVGEEPRMLAGATRIGVYDVVPLVERYGGFAYPAHIDRPSFSLLSNLGLWDPTMGFTMAELSRNVPPGFTASRPDVRNLFTIGGSDAHYLDQIADAHQYMDLPEKTPEAVLNWLRGRPRPQC